MLSPEIPRLFLQGDKRIVRLFPSYKDVELAYFRKTGIFPIMHVTTIKQEIVDKHPWVATNLVKAFEEAKNIAYRRIANPRMPISSGTNENASGTALPTRSLSAAADGESSARLTATASNAALN